MSRLLVTLYELRSELLPPLVMFSRALVSLNLVEVDLSVGWADSRIVS